MRAVAWVAGCARRMTCSHTILLDLWGKCPICNEGEEIPKPAQTAPKPPLNRLKPLQTDVPSVSLEEADKLCEVEESRRHLRSFVQRGWHVTDPSTELEWNWHHDAFCDHLQWVFEDWQRARDDKAFTQRAKTALFNVPPGSLKSRIISVFFPAWAWLRAPYWSAICLSANPNVALRDALLSRDVITSNWYQESFKPEWTLRTDKAAISDFKNTAGGYRLSRGLTAKVVGDRADWLVVDDPHDPEEALSDDARQKVIDRWRSTAHNRVNNERIAVRVGVMQRLHEEDWSGYQLNAGLVDVHVRLPTEYEAKTDCPCGTCDRENVFGFKDPRTIEGESLHPERFTEEFVAKEKVRLGSYSYAGQHQQRPAPLEGGLFQYSWWSEYDSLPDLQDRILSVDATNGITDHADNTSMLVLGRNQGQRFIVDNITCKMGIIEQIRNIRVLLERHPLISRVLVELKSNGQAIVDKLTQELGYSHVIGIKIPPHSTKASRAIACQPAVEAGNVWVPRNAPWKDAFLHEICTFPKAKHDDQVDAFSQGMIYMEESPAMARFKALAER